MNKLAWAESARRGKDFAMLVWRLPRRIVFLSVLSLAALSACSKMATAGGEPRASEKSTAEFALYALSRGKGVPDATRSVLQKAQALLKDARQRGEVLELTETRIGLEGETRVCVKAKDAAQARNLVRAVRTIAKDVELFNVVEEPCLKR